MNEAAAAAHPLDFLWNEEPTGRADRARVRYRIGLLHCSLCTGTIEKALGRIPGVEKVAVSLTHEQALVEFDPRLVRPRALLQTLRDIGYTIHDPRKLRPFEEEERDLVREGRRFLAATAFSLLSLALILHPTGPWSLVVPAIATLSLGAFVFLVLRASGLLPAVGGALGLGLAALGILVMKEQSALSAITPWLVGTLAAALVFGVGRHILWMAFQTLRRGILNQHVLFEAGAFAGLIGGVIGLAFDLRDYPTAPFFAVTVMIGTYHIFSEWLSLIVKTRSSQAVKRLLDLQPETANVVRHGSEIVTVIADVRIEDLIRIRPGERVPVDGVVTEGHSAVDQSLVTGEPMPVERSAGDAVIGGSVNGTGTLLVRATAVGDESFLHRVVRQVEQARALKPGLLHLVDRVLRVYTPAVLSIALVAVLGWIVGPLLLGGETDVERAVFAGLSVLVMGYPCAVGISAPLSIVRGAGEAAERGILMRTGEAFQGYRLARHIIFDKTGTLTEGRPVLREVEALGVNDSELIGIAAAVESASEHPLAQAVVEAAFDRGITPPSVTAFRAIPGKGVDAEIAGARVIVGSPRFLAENGIAATALAHRIAALEEMGRTVIGVGSGGRLFGILAFGDTVRAGAAEMVRTLKQAGLRLALVSGDNLRAARRIAAEVGIEEVHADKLPGDKVELVRRLQQGSTVAMVGDGINDAPALMQADIGIALGSGTDIAIESADIIILSNRIEAVAVAREISRRSYRKMVQNVSLAFLFNGIGVPLAATGLVYPVWAMAAMAVSVTAIFFNSLWGRPGLFFQAILSVGRAPQATASPARVAQI